MKSSFFMVVGFLSCFLVDVYVPLGYSMWTICLFVYVGLYGLYGKEITWRGFVLCEVSLIAGAIFSTYQLPHHGLVNRGYGMVIFFLTYLMLKHLDDLEGGGKP